MSGVTKKSTRRGQRNRTPSSEQSEDGPEVYEKQLHQAIENTSVKRQEIRLEAYWSIGNALVQRNCPDALAHQKMALMESIKRSLRKGKDGEEIFAARVIPLLALQSETNAAVTELMETLKPEIIDKIKDGNPKNFDLRAECCTVLGMLCFLGEYDTNDYLSTMKILQEVLEDVTVQHSGQILSAALYSWSLLLTLLSPAAILEHLQNGSLLLPRKLMAMLDSSYLDVRAAAGETLALLHELCHPYDRTILQDIMADLLETVHRLSTDAFRFQQKRGRKLQRITFRDVLLYLREGIVPEVRIKFGDEQLLLNSWTMNLRYNCLKRLLGMALNVHLMENAMVRDMLKLEPKVDKAVKCEAGRSKEKQFGGAAAKKERTVSRGKKRGKRMFSLE